MKKLRLTKQTVKDMSRFTHILYDPAHFNSLPPIYKQCLYRRVNEYFAPKFKPDTIRVRYIDPSRIPDRAKDFHENVMTLCLIESLREYRKMLANIRPDQLPHIISKITLLINEYETAVMHEPQKLQSNG